MVPDSSPRLASRPKPAVLLALDVPERTVMGVMGWSSTSMAARYQHVTDPIRQEVASRVGGLLWSRQRPNETKTETTFASPPPLSARSGRRFVSLTSGGGCGIRTREGVNPTRFPNPQIEVHADPQASVYAWEAIIRTLTDGYKRRQLRP